MHAGKGGPSAGLITYVCGSGKLYFVIQASRLLTHISVTSALKLRYMIPVVVPSQDVRGSSATNTPLPSPTAARFPASQTQPPIMFDAKIVARKDSGWEDMLETLLMRWVHLVVEERRLAR